MRYLVLIVIALVVPFAAVVLPGCGGHGGGSGNNFGLPPPAVISNLNGSSNPASPAGVAIEIQGTGFGVFNGTITFQQGSAVPITVAPVQSSWSDTDVLAVVPSTLSPGAASVFLTTQLGVVSNVVSFTVTTTTTFSPSSVTWGATTALPTALRAHGAAAVQTGSTGAWIYVLGGNDGSATVNTNTVLFASLDSTGSVGAWTATTPLPAPVAFMAVAQANPNNSSVAAGSAFIYAIGGQATPTGAPGGTTSVFVGTVNLATGGVTWASGTALPETRVGARAVVANGFLHVTGGLSATGTAIGLTASAPVLASGALGSFTEVSSVPSPVAFHESFAFGGNLYVIGGDLGPQSTPFSVASSMATKNVWFAPIRAGVVGTWSTTSGTIKSREKATLLFAFGQLMFYEGSYGGTSTEAERSSVNADGTLGSWNGQTGGSIPGLNVFNCAGVTSPLLTGTSTPRFLILGGDSVTAPGTLSAVVDKTTAP